jgi:hypothetical protein
MRSPIKRRPLRNPGDSLTEYIQDVLFDRVFLYLILALFAVSLAFMEWIRWYFNSPTSPKLLSVLAVMVVLIATYKIRRELRYVSQLKLGRDGEMAVGQFLESLRGRGAQVLHDLPGEGFNVDHVVIHPSGIYAIETKTFSKPDRGEAKILFDGESVEILGKRPERNPVVQARAIAKWLQGLVRSSTGKNFEVRPVVVFPGWFIQPTAEAKHSNVWVLNPKALPSFIENSKPQISESDVHLIKTHLSMYARSALATKR